MTTCRALLLRDLKDAPRSACVVHTNPGNPYSPVVVRATPAAIFLINMMG